MHCDQIRTLFSSTVMLTAVTVFLSIGGGPVPSTPTLQKDQAGWDRVGLLHMMFFMQKQRT